MSTEIEQLCETVQQQCPPTIQHRKKNTKGLRVSWRIIKHCLEISLMQTSADLKLHYSKTVTRAPHGFFNIEKYDPLRSKFNVEMPQLERFFVIRCLVPSHQSKKIPRDSPYGLQQDFTNFHQDQSCLKETKLHQKLSGTCCSERWEVQILRPVFSEFLLPMP